jgi:hypothetical protein
MSRSVRMHEFGGPEVLRLEDVVVGEPGAGEVRLRIDTRPAVVPPFDVFARNLTIRGVALPALARTLSMCTCCRSSTSIRQWRGNRSGGDRRGMAVPPHRKRQRGFFRGGVACRSAQMYPAC